MKKTFFMLSAVLIALACNKPTTTDPIDPTTLLKKSWIHSYEEDNHSNDTSTYRPSDYKDFGPSRYRQVFRFKEDSVCEYFVLAPDDGHYFDTGKWDYNKVTKQLIIQDKDDKIIYKFNVLQLKDTLLKVARE